MTKITFTSVETLGEQENIRNHINTVGNTWDEQVGCFYEFLVGQGFIISYKAFLERFGDIVGARKGAEEGF